MEELHNSYTPIRILMTTDTVGGVWSYSIELCKALLPCNVHFYLITTGTRMQPAQQREMAALANVTVYETDFLLEWMENPWQNVDASGKWLLQLEEKLQPDLIHINGYVYGSLPWKAPAIIVAHSDVFSWFLSVKKMVPPAQWNEYFTRVRAGLEGADLLIAPSKTMLQFIREIYGAITPGKVIYNGRNDDIFYPKQKQQYVFSMGRIWDEAKNIQLLIKASSHIYYPIKLAGDNRFENNSSSIESDNIIYLGKLSMQEVAVQLSTAAVYVLPATYEPFGLSILEAALSGCALVLGKIESLQEIWGDSAVYVNTNDVDELAHKVNELMENEWLRNHYAQEAMNRAKQYATTAMAENYLQVYRQLLQQEQLVSNTV
ncbi:glycosyltransferase family 4 protein [Ilyomonas limi]|uniref:Glycosyltransferase family 4 protein n=1 Tax=Ilyomonas limi TaxID=2575867 RepID=A0A4U3L9R0_9BACT|nr:glycosyltransferase family 4 protein [Ilyomonas limi]TKK71822.1 glycosyltransferase family 4 protein [Ilyomonas limi]